jgi:hypothetical protein
MGRIEVHNVTGDFELAGEHVSKGLEFCFLWWAHNRQRLSAFGDRDGLALGLDFIEESETLCLELGYSNESRAHDKPSLPNWSDDHYFFGAGVIASHTASPVRV